ncbi:fluoride efflux transporter FluC [Catenulispora pinisilvae]|uniref:fluoride efflux transporter FluC n=1 Tax=Catenulispora pinisilvae TaxID=2705253 RepID=UPI002B274920|nr:CrcB family protein [Catenulispora pinisilvae]
MSSPQPPSDAGHEPGPHPVGPHHLGPHHVGPHHAWHHEVPPEGEGSSVEAPAPAAPASGPGTGRVVAVIAAGGFLGGPTRYLLGQAFPTAQHTFPATTFVINVTGAFVLAVLLVCVIEVWPPTHYVRPFGAVGFLGAYTTFSTWMVDTDRFLAAGRYGLAALDVFGSLFSGLAATALGIFLARAALVRRSPGWSRA